MTQIKVICTPKEFGNLTFTLGVTLSDAELHEAILKIDEDGNGKIEIEEYLLWWGDPTLIQLFKNVNKCPDEHQSLKTTEESKTKVFRQRSLTDNDIRGKQASTASSQYSRFKGGKLNHPNKNSELYPLRRGNVARRIGWAIERYEKLTTVPLKIGNDALRPGSALPILTSNMKNVTDGNVSISTIAKETGMRGNVKENVLRTTSVSALDSESDMLKRSRRKKKMARLKDAIERGRMVVESSVYENVTHS